jgi:alanine racemase
MSYQSRKTQALINLTALKQNYQTIATLAPNSETIAVIKANAYGHGSLPVAQHLENVAAILAVAFVDEAITLRNEGITAPILILEGPLCQQDIATAINNNFWLMLHNTEQLDWLIKHPSTYTEKIWLKVDTGMHRLGFMPQDIANVITTLRKEQQKNVVICTHFSNAEELDNPKTTRQIARIRACSEDFQCQLSLANSAGILNWPQAHADYNRLGISLYGANPISGYDLPITLAPVMTLQSTVIALRKLNKGDSVGYGGIWQAQRPSLIATIAIGYADGYPRSAKAGTPVWVNGELAPVAGRVSMDMITIDVTDIAQVKIGDTVELWGENLAVETVAKYTDTINYELLTRVSARVPKQYIY